MVFTKPCKICDKIFQPVSRSNKLCEECRKVRQKVAIRNMKKTKGIL